MAGDPLDNPPKRLISVAEAGQRLGISESAAYRLAAVGALPGQVKLGARRWVRARVLEAWLDGADARADRSAPDDLRAPARDRYR